MKNKIIKNLDDLIDSLENLHIFHEKNNEEKNEILIIENILMECIDKILISNKIIHPHDYKCIDLNNIHELPLDYPLEFKNFCKNNDLKPPKINTGNGKALSLMLQYPNTYWNREKCDEFVNKFKIETRDSIQLFNKHSQWGIKTSSDLNDRGKQYIIYPYCLTNKHKMRKDFTYNGNDEEKNEEINKIKSTIKNDYIDVANDKWQLGHKNPGSINNSNSNLILQPPIQGKYRDDYLFFDTLTKMPLPKKLEKMIENNEIELTTEQIQSYFHLFQKLLNFKLDKINNNNK